MIYIVRKCQVNVTDSIENIVSNALKKVFYFDSMRPLKRIF